MDKSLFVYTYVDGVNDAAFPNKINHVHLSSFNYTSKRMGSSPSINSTIMSADLLSWKGNEYVIYNEEKYFLTRTPSNSFSNEDARYKYELDFTSERIILDNTYFIDIVTEDVENDKYRSNSGEVTFFGDIEEFAQRLNYFFKYTKIDYTVVIDEGTTSEALIVSLSNNFVSQALQQIYELYKVPYYFKGREIHIGFTSNAITKVFKYGIEDSLLSINKQNTNTKVVNRATGIGSSDNIEYYYPNENNKSYVKVVADIDNKSIKTEDISIVDYDVFKDKVKLNSKIEYSITDITKENNLKFYSFPNDSFEMEVNGSRGDKLYEYRNFWRDQSNKLRFYVRDVSTYMRYSSIGESEVSISAFGDIGLYIKDTSIRGDRNIRYFSMMHTDLRISCNGRYAEESFPNAGVYATIPVKDGINYIAISLKARTIVDKEYAANTSIWVKWSPRVSYTIKKERWKSKDVPVTLSDVGLSITQKPSDGDSFYQRMDTSIISTPIAKTLMPPIYRESKGMERFYLAKNETYKDPNTGEFYVFDNEYVESNPKEAIFTFDHIKPSIKNIKNTDGRLIGQIEDIAFDDGDNDELKEDGTSFIHPYFYIRLRKIDGDYGFNLFDKAISSGEMTISMTSGNCAACQFVIEAKEVEQDSYNIYKNPVQVDNNGNIVAGDNDKKVNTANIIASQQDSIVNSIWLVVKKDDSTFGVTMPNATSGYKPNIGDSFVLLNINLPNTYILSAENELKEAIIKTMFENNREKFTFSIKFSRIYLANNPDILKLIDENARLRIEYNNDINELYVTSYTYKVSNNEVLPEITIELSGEISISQGTMDKIVSNITYDMMNSIGSIDFYKQGLKYFIRKDVDDYANGHVVFNNGIYVTGKTIQEEDANYIQEGDYNSIQEGIVEDITDVISLGELSNVSPLVDSISIEEVVLTREANDTVWRAKKIISGGGESKVYKTTLSFSDIMGKNDEYATPSEIEEVRNIVEKYKSGYVVSISDNTGNPSYNGIVNIVSYNRGGNPIFSFINYDDYIVKIELNDSIGGVKWKIDYKGGYTIYRTSLPIGDIEKRADKSITQEEKDEFFEIINKYKTGSVVTISDESGDINRYGTVSVSTGLYGQPATLVFNDKNGNVISFTVDNLNLGGLWIVDNKTSGGGGSGESSKVYNTSLMLSTIWGRPEKSSTQQEVDEVRNIIDKYKTGYVVTIADNTDTPVYNGVVNVVCADQGYTDIELSFINYTGYVIRFRLKELTVGIKWEILDGAIGSGGGSDEKVYTTSLSLLSIKAGDLLMQSQLDELSNIQAKFDAGYSIMINDYNDSSLYYGNLQMGSSFKNNITTFSVTIISGTGDLISYTMTDLIVGISKWIVTNKTSGGGGSDSPEVYKTTLPFHSINTGDIVTETHNTEIENIIYNYMQGRCVTYYADPSTGSNTYANGGMVLSAYMSTTTFETELTIAIGKKIVTYATNGPIAGTSVWTVSSMVSGGGSTESKVYQTTFDFTQIHEWARILTAEHLAEAENIITKSAEGCVVIWKHDAKPGEHNYFSAGTVNAYIDPTTFSIELTVVRGKEICTYATDGAIPGESRWRTIKHTEKNKWIIEGVMLDNGNIIFEAQMSEYEEGLYAVVSPNISVTVDGIPYMIASPFTISLRLSLSFVQGVNALDGTSRSFMINVSADGGYFDIQLIRLGAGELLLSATPSILVQII